MANENIKLYQFLLNSFPIILLFFFALTGYTLSFDFFEINISFNFIYLIVFYWVLRKPEMLGYGLIFFAGVINDVVQNLPIGISSINYLLLCVIASFFRARTLVPNLIYDWVLFLIAILIVSSIHFSLLAIVFEETTKYGALMSKSFFSFLIYPLIAKLFNQIYLLGLRQENVE
tara:strand:+ start:801 stop:1322 length:522 start_codon:yes stop_codon:yes gene_type:complete